MVIPRAYIDRILSSKPVQRVWCLPYNLWREIAVAIARCLQFDLTKVALQHLAGHAVAAVTAVVASRIVFLVTQVLAQLRLHGPLQHHFGNLPEQSLYVFGLPPLPQPLVYQFIADRWPCLR